MTHSTLAREAAPPRGDGLHPLLAALWVAAICIAWWAVLRRQLDDVGMADALASAGAERAAPWIAVSSALSRLGATALEATFYWSFWRLWGDRFRFGRMFVAIATLSLIDAWSATLQSLVRASLPGLAGVLAPVLGMALARPLPTAATPAVAAGAWGIAFGTLGLTTLLRVALTARVFAAETRRRLVPPLVLVSAAWLVTRIALGLGLDLVRGASPLP